MVQLHENTGLNHIYLKLVLLRKISCRKDQGSLVIQPGELAIHIFLFVEVLESQLDV